MPVLMRIDHPAILLAPMKSKVRACHVTGAATRRLSSERYSARLDRLSVFPVGETARYQKASGLRVVTETAKQDCAADIHQVRSGLSPTHLSLSILSRPARPYHFRGRRNLHFSPHRHADRRLCWLTPGGGGMGQRARADAARSRWSITTSSSPTRSSGAPGRRRHLCRHCLQFRSTALFNSTISSHHDRYFPAARHLQNSTPCQPCQSAACVAPSKSSLWDIDKFPFCS